VEDESYDLKNDKELNNYIKRFDKEQDIYITDIKDHINIYNYLLELRMYRKLGTLNELYTISRHNSDYIIKQINEYFNGFVENEKDEDYKMMFMYMNEYIVNLFEGVTGDE
jgi:hypothetical protein